MMPRSYFKKEVPRTPIFLSSGDAVRFDSFDGVTGYYSTEDPKAIEDFKKLMARGAGGLTEMTAEEFDEAYTKKKPHTPSYVWPREGEAVRPGPSLDTTGQRPPAAPVVVEAPLVTPPLQTSPRVGKRPSPQ